MKKRTKIIIIASIILLAAVIISIICIVNYRSYLYLFKDTDYPVAAKWDEGALLVKVKDKTRSNIVWTAASEDPDFVVVDLKGKTGTKKASYILTPQTPGTVDVSFMKSVEAGNITVDKVKIILHLYVRETLEGFAVSLSKEPELIFGDEVLGEGTDYPAILRSRSEFVEYDENTKLRGNIFFVNGIGDWNVNADNADIYISNSEYEGVDNYAMYLSYLPDIEGPFPEDSESDGGESDDSSESNYDPGIIGTETDTLAETPDFYETSLTMSSQTLGITQTFNVKFYADNHVEFTKINTDR